MKRQKKMPPRPGTTIFKKMPSRPGTTIFELTEMMGGRLSIKALRRSYKELRSATDLPPFALWDSECGMWQHERRIVRYELLRKLDARPAPMPAEFDAFGLTAAQRWAAHRALRSAVAARIEQEETLDAVTETLGLTPKQRLAAYRTRLTPLATRIEREAAPDAVTETRNDVESELKFTTNPDNVLKGQLGAAAKYRRSVTEPEPRTPGDLPPDLLADVERRERYVLFTGKAGKRRRSEVYGEYAFELFEVADALVESGVTVTNAILASYALLQYWGLTDAPDMKLVPKRNWFKPRAPLELKDEQILLIEAFKQHRKKLSRRPQRG